jgi:hypothetical protein
MWRLTVAGKGMAWDRPSSAACSAAFKQQGARAGTDHRPTFQVGLNVIGYSFFIQPAQRRRPPETRIFRERRPFFRPSRPDGENPYGSVGGRHLLLLFVRGEMRTRGRWKTWRRAIQCGHDFAAHIGSGVVVIVEFRRAYAIAYEHYLGLGRGIG